MLLPRTLLPHQTFALVADSYNGGVIDWYYTFTENINGWPKVDATTGFLATEPQLVSGASWYGPVSLPNGSTGFVQSTARNKAGNYYKTKFECKMPGFASNNLQNLSNSAGKQFVIVARLRSGNFWVVIGNNKKGLEFDNEANTAQGAKAAAINKITLSLESAKPLQVLPSFAGINSIPPISIAPPAPVIPRIDYEEIDFNTSGDTVIDLTINNRIGRFTNYPIIEVYEFDGTIYRIGNMPIITSGTPPTSITVQNAGGAGKIILK
ncbi:hypothetical protein ACFOW1_01670 [Parasediminibacterium paludis]|uniref:Uncharacterized protein n=1 Tax=Parasediminibacterium paludis TaxID=908966 RepID=A0ABV8PTM0_9BACT